MRKIIIKILLLCVVAFGLSGCKLIFEPESDAVSRMLSNCPSGNYRHYRELCDGEKVCGQLGELAGILASDWYNARKGFFTVTAIERAEDTGYSYVYVDLRMPAGGNQKETTMPLVFEMQRIKLRWHIYSVKGLDEYLRRATRARGIL